MGLTKVSYSMIEGAVVNVLDYGAVGDGTTESATAFNNAIATLSSGGVLYIPAGQYKISSTVTLDDDVSVVGEGTSSVILCNVASDNTDAINGVFCAKSKSNISINNLKFISYAGTGSMRSKFILCNNVQVANCYFDGDLTSGDIGSYPIWIAGCSTAKVSNVTSYNFSDHVYICSSNWSTGTSSENVVVENSHFENTSNGTSQEYPTGVYVYYGNYTTVNNCTFKNILPSTVGAGFIGYGVYEGDGNAIELNVIGCTFLVDKATPANNYMTGCVSTQADYFNVNSCSFVGTSSAQFYTAVGYAAQNTIVNGCNISYALTGIFLAKTASVSSYKNWSVTNNIVTNCSIGIRAGAGNATATEIDISNNTIDNISQTGLLVNSTSTYVVTCNGNVINNANTSNGSTQPFDSGIAFFGGIASGNVSGNTINNNSGVGFAKYGVSISSSTNQAIIISTSNRIVGMVTGSVRNPYTAAPSAGTWSQGESITNWNATVGQPKGWICTVSGTPGTWVSTGNL